MAPGDRKTKKSLFTSPFSAEKQSKVKKSKTNSPGESEEGDMGDDVQRREGEEQTGWVSPVEVTAIHEAVLTSIRGTLGACKSKEGEGGEMNALIEKLIPLMATAVSVAIGETMKVMAQDLDRRYGRPTSPRNAPNPSEARLLRSATILTYENDRLEQYSRRESVRIFGIQGEDGETTEALEKKAIKVFADAGVEIKPDDISVIHRAGNHQRSGPRPILVRFVSRKKRQEVMTKKKSLKDKTQYKKVFINDDLTPLRARLLAMVKKLDCVHRAWTVEGRIYCSKKQLAASPNARPAPIVIESPDDLFKLGVDEVDFEQLGLSHLVEAD